MIPLRGTAAGTPLDAYNTAIRRGARRGDFLSLYLKALYDDAATLGINADVLVAQWDLETGAGTSARWINEGNPAGIGITDGKTDAGYRFNADEAARVHVTHMACYLGITPPPSWIAADFRWQAALDAGFFGSVTTTADLGKGKWATDPDYADKLLSRYTAYWGTPQNEEPPMALTFGRVPHPGYVDLQHTTADKPEGRGWDNLGRRQPKFIALHRMWGTLRGTDSHFANPNVASLTDYGIGTANIDGKALDGRIHKYNDPTGFRSGWASGRVSAPYGDGLKIVNKYGVNAVNRDGISIETSGYDTEPFTDFAWSELVKLVAYWADQCKIPYTSLPLNPHTGINFIIWHEEFTFGTGKKCPFTWMKQNTNRLYRDVIAYLKPFQEGTAGQPQPEPQEPEVPAPQYAAPRPILELIPFTNNDTNPHLVTREADEFHFVGDRLRATERTARLQFAASNAPHTGPYIEVGEEFDADWKVRAADGQWYYVTPYWTRILADHTERIADAA